jgi:hypothetical protein
VAEKVEHLPGKHRALSSNPSIIQEKTIEELFTVKSEKTNHKLKEGISNTCYQEKIPI